MIHVSLLSHDISELESFRIATGCIWKAPARKLRNKMYNVSASIDPSIFDMDTRVVRAIAELDDLGHYTGEAIRNDIRPSERALDNMAFLVKKYLGSMSVSVHDIG